VLVGKPESGNLLKEVGAGGRKIWLLQFRTEVRGLFA
jgi:hypothetical protein